MPRDAGQVHHAVAQVEDRLLLPLPDLQEQLPLQGLSPPAPVVMQADDRQQAAGDVPFLCGEVRHLGYHMGRPPLGRERSQPWIGSSPCCTTGALPMATAPSAH